MTPEQIKIRKRKDHGRWLARRSGEFKMMKAKHGEETLWESLGKPEFLNYYQLDRYGHKTALRSAYFDRIDKEGMFILTTHAGGSVKVDIMQITDESLLKLT